MSDDLKDEVLHYLLDELEPGRRAAFDERLARDGAAREAWREATEALANFAGEAAPAEALTPADQRRVLAALREETARESAQVGWSAAGWGWRWAWPVAAALLLGLNAWQFFGARAGGGITGVVGRGEASRVAARTGANDAGTAGDEQGGTVRSDGTRGDDSRMRPGHDGGSATKELQRLNALRGDYANPERASAALRAEYDDIIQRLTQRALVEQGVGRLAAMELVDPGSYARGERKGLMDLARGILTQPGIVSIGPATTTATPSTPATVTPDPNSAAVVPGSVTSVVGGGAMSAVGSGVTSLAPLPSTSTPPTSPPPTPSTPESAYAWSVFDEAEHQGYLNLYHLPTVPEGQSLQLWVKPADSTTYERVGEVPPEFYGQSGSVVYKLPATSATPVEILVTQEPKAAPPEVPSGPEVLHGP